MRVVFFASIVRFTVAPVFIVAVNRTTTTRTSPEQSARLWPGYPAPLPFNSSVAGAHPAIATQLRSDKGIFLSGGYGRQIPLQAKQLAALCGSLSVRPGHTGCTDVLVVMPIRRVVEQALLIHPIGLPAGAAVVTRFDSQLVAAIVIGITCVTKRVKRGLNIANSTREHQSVATGLGNRDRTWIIQSQVAMV